MRVFLLILFLTLWKFNTNICNYYYDYKSNFSEWYYLRCDIYEAMFLIALLITFFKTTLYSRTLIFFGSVLIGWSVIDKNILSNYNTLEVDMFIILPLAITSSLYYLYHQKKIK